MQGRAVVLNQEGKDFWISRILSILASFLSWFKTNCPGSDDTSNSKRRLIGALCPSLK